MLNIKNNMEPNNIQNKKLVICTTAIIRPEMHTFTIGGFYDQLNKVINNYKIDIYHIINIDSPEKLVKSGFSSDITEKNLIKIIPKYVRVFINKTKTPNFLNACGNIIETIKENKLVGDEYLYFWFEDDWVIKNISINILEVIETFANPNVYINMTNSVIGVTQPVIVGSNLFQKFFIDAIISNNKYDPESNVRNTLINYLNKKHIPVNIYFIECGDFGKKYDMLYEERENLSFGKYDVKIKSTKKRFIVNKLNEIPKLDLTTVTSIIIHPIFFEDVGRKWSEQFNLIKWSKKNDTFTYH